jgi:predicted lipoprotein with Yx(FWY)xxD motif
MAPSLTLRRPLLLVAGLALVASACGSTGSTAATAGHSSSATTAAQGSSGAVATVRASTVPGLGRVLVDSSGRTLYLLTSDHQGSPTCTGSGGCTSLWPPLMAAASLHAGMGASQAMLGKVNVSGEGKQVTYDRWPLYTYAGDSGPGQGHGEGIKSFGGTWYAVTPAGRPFTGSAGSPPTTAHTYGGY